MAAPASRVSSRAAAAASACRRAPASARRTSAASASTHMSWASTKLHATCQLRYDTAMARVLMPLPDRDFDPDRDRRAVAHADARGARGRLRHRARQRRARGRSAAARRQARLARPGRRAARVLRRDGGLARVHAADRVERDRARRVRRPHPARRPRARHAPVPRLVAAAGKGRAPSGAPGRPVGAICHGVLVLARAKDPATGKSVLARRAHDLPAEVHGARRLPHDLLEARALLPHLRRLRRGRGARRRSATPRSSSSAARSSSRSAAPNATTSAPSSSRTAATSRRAGPATPTYSRAASPPASRIRRDCDEIGDEGAQRLACARVVVGRAQDRRRVHRGQRVPRQRRGQRRGRALWSTRNGAPEERLRRRGAERDDDARAAPPPARPRATGGRRRARARSASGGCGACREAASHLKCLTALVT